MYFRLASFIECRYLYLIRLRLSGHRLITPLYVPFLQFHYDTIDIEETTKCKVIDD